jgi:hypothetical protein
MEAIRKRYGDELPEHIGNELSQIYGTICIHLESSDFPNSTHVEQYLKTETNTVSTEVATLLHQAIMSGYYSSEVFEFLSNRNSSKKFTCKKY